MKRAEKRNHIVNDEKIENTDFKNCPISEVLMKTDETFSSIFSKLKSCFGQIFTFLTDNMVTWFVVKSAMNVKRLN